jgi:CheY-like chemotaxis protein
MVISSELETYVPGAGRAMLLRSQAANEPLDTDIGIAPEDQDRICMDLRLHRMGGLEAARRIRATAGGNQANRSNCRLRVRSRARGVPGGRYE